MSATTRDGRNGSNRSYGDGKRASISSHSSEEMPIARNARLPFGWAHTPALPLRGVSTLDALKAEAGEAVRITREYADGLTTKDHDLLKAFSRGQYLTGVLRFMEIGLKCQEVAAATALPEVLRGFTVRHHPRAHVCYLEAFASESDSNGGFDVAQIAFAAERTEANRRRAIEAGNRQLAETYRSLNALHRAEVER